MLRIPSKSQLLYCHVAGRTTCWVLTKDTQVNIGTIAGAARSCQANVLETADWELLHSSTPFSIIIPSRRM